MDTNKKMIVRATIDTSLVANKTVREVERLDYAIQKAGSSVKAGIDQRLAIAAMFVWRQIRGYRYTDNGTQLKIKKLLDVAHETRVSFIQQHIINYSTFYVLVDFYDWLCDKKLITKPAEGYWRKVQRSFEDYQKAQKAFLSSS